MKKMIGPCLGALAFVAIGSFTMPTRADDGPTIDDFTFMVGHWVAPVGAGGYEEGWFPPAAGVMSGMFRWPDAGGSGRYVLELLTIVEEDDGIRFYFKHFDPDITAWEKEEANTYSLISVENQCGRFALTNENPNVPDVIQYCRLDDITLEFRGVNGTTPLEGSDFVLRFTALGASRD